MTIDLSTVTPVTYTECFDPHGVRRHADLWAADNNVSSTSREVLGYLLQTAGHLSALSYRLTLAYAEDSYDITTTPFTALSFGERPHVLAMASTCAHNAALFLAEARRRPVRRRLGWDPITTPETN